MKNIFKNKKYTLIISIISMVVLVGITGTYAWYVWSSNDEQRTRIVTSVGAVNVIYDDGASMSGVNLKPVENKTDGIVKDISVKTSADSTNRVSFNLYLDINTLGEGLKHESFKYELWDEDSLVKSGDFTQEYLDNNLVTCDKNSTSHIVLLSGVTITKTTSKYTLYIWIDGVNYTNPDTMMNQKFSFKLHADGQNAITGQNFTLAYNILNKYNSSDNKVNVLNNGVTYSYDTKNSLMEDVDGNVRYYGANANNYIYFNCNDYNNQSSSTCEVWRIIGVFDGKVKIVRDKSLGSFAYDYRYNEATGTYTYYNYWNGATLNQLLNDGYYNNKNGIVTYGVKSNADITITSNFASDGTGIKNDETRNMIADNIWYLGEVSGSTYADGSYSSERAVNSKTGIPDTWKGKIGLMYQSDYGYSTDLSVCKSTIGNYNAAGCKSNSWVPGGQWLISTYGSADVKYIMTAGNVVNNGIKGARVIFPTLYLNDNVIRVSGDGSSNNPYRLSTSVNAVEYISNLYLDNKNKVVTNNNIEYQYAESVNLMNDRLGGTTEDYDAGNIRYYGASPNNYVYFNCDDYNRQSSSTCEMWRIIGVFDNKLKIIREESLGAYAWEHLNASTWDNNWHDSTLMTLLNYDYYNNNDGVIYYYWDFSNGDTQEIINFKKDNKGIKNIETQDMMSESTWYLGGWHTSEIYVNDIYGYERGNTKCSSCTYETEWEGKIALMYPSDYGYATDFNSCKEKLYGYDSSTRTYTGYATSGCFDKDWLYDSNHEWLLTPVSLESSSNSLGYYKAWSLSNRGSLEKEGSAVWGSSGVRPVLYLDSELVIEFGEGTKEAPYVLG